MVKDWGDYGISTIRYNSAGTHIDQVRIHQNNGGAVGPAGVWSREQVVSALKSNYKIITLTKNKEGKWFVGAQVIIVVIAGNEYIKTVRDSTTRDNLGSLPTF